MAGAPAATPSDEHAAAGRCAATQLAKAERRGVDAGADPPQAQLERFRHAQRSGQLLARGAGQRADHLAERLDRQHAARPAAQRCPPRREAGQALLERRAVGPAELGGEQRGAGPQRDHREDQQAAHAATAAGGSAGWGGRASDRGGPPAEEARGGGQPQVAAGPQPAGAHQGERHQHDGLPGRRGVGGAAAADHGACGRHARRHDQHEAPGEADAGLLGAGVLAAFGLLAPVLGERLEAQGEVGAADLVGDEQRLARDVGGGVGEAAPQHVERAAEVEGQQPLPLGRLEGGAQLARGAPSRLEQRLGQRAPQRERVDPDLLDQPGPGLLGAGQPGRPPGTVEVQRHGGGGQRHDQGGQQPTEEAERDQPAGQAERQAHGQRTPTGRSSARPAWTSQSAARPRTPGRRRTDGRARRPWPPREPAGAGPAEPGSDQQVHAGAGGHRQQQRGHDANRAARSSTVGAPRASRTSRPAWRNSRPARLGTEPGPAPAVHPARRGRTAR